MDFSEVPIACADSEWLTREFLPSVEHSLLNTPPCVVTMPTDSHDESEFLLGRAKRFLQVGYVNAIHDLRLSRTDPTLAWEGLFGIPDASRSFDAHSECRVLIVHGGNYLPEWFISEHIGQLEKYARSFRVSVLLPLARSIANGFVSSAVLPVPSFATSAEPMQKGFIKWAVERYVGDLRDDPSIDRSAGRTELCDIIWKARPLSRTTVEFWLDRYVAMCEKSNYASVLEIAREHSPEGIRILFPEPSIVASRDTLRESFDGIMRLLKHSNSEFNNRMGNVLFRDCHELPSPFDGPDPHHWFMSCISQLSCLYFDAAKRSGLDVASSYRVDLERSDIVNAEKSPFVHTLRLLRTYFQHGLCIEDGDDSRTLAKVAEWFSQTIGTQCSFSRDNARLCLARLLVQCRECVEQLAAVVLGLGEWPTTYSMADALKQNARTFAEHQIDKAIVEVIRRLDLDVDSSEVVRLHRAQIVRDIKESTCKIVNLEQELNRVVEIYCHEANRRFPPIGDYLKTKGVESRQMSDICKRLKKAWDDDPKMSPDQLRHLADVEVAGLRETPTSRQ